VSYRSCPHELILFAMFLCLATYMCGCSSSYPVRSTAVQGAYTYGMVNDAIKGERVTIKLRDGSDILANDVTVAGDSVSWFDARTEHRSAASVRKVEKIVNKNHFLGAMEWLGMGIVGGAGIALLVIGTTGSHTGEIGEHWVEISLIVGGGLGTIVGTVTGLAVGHSYNYELESNEQADSLGHGK